MEKETGDRISYQEVIKVLPEHIDRLQHVNNVVYLQWVNDISEKHWGVLSNEDIDSRYYWVAIRHEIDYLRSAKIGDQVTVLTWIGKTEGVRSVRHVEMFKDKKLITRAKTTWCLMDKRSNRPVRVSSEILDLLKINRDPE